MRPVLLKWIVVLLFACSCRAAVASAQVPVPSHSMYFGYYYADGRWGDYTSEVANYTNLYVALPCGYDTILGCPATTGSAFANSLNAAYSAGKNIILFMDGDSATWSDTLDIAAPYWSQIKLIEAEHESSDTTSQAESHISGLLSLLSTKSLATRPIGIGCTRQQVEGSTCQYASNADWIEVEAYVAPPGDSTSSVNVNDLNGFLDDTKSEVPSGKQLIFTLMAYDRNGSWTDISTLTDLQMPPYLKAYDDSRVIGLLMFAYQRVDNVTSPTQGGTRFHPDLKVPHEQIGSAMGISARMVIDAPANNSTTTSFTFTASGWALDLAAATGTGIDAIQLYAYPIVGGVPGSPTFLGYATYGGSRTDVGAYYGSQFNNTGYSMSVSSLTAGTYLIVVYPHSSVSGAFNQFATTTVTIPAGSPYMAIDAPTANATVSQPFTASGWAVDLAATSGPGVDVLPVYAFPVGGGGPTFLGFASYSGYRPDVGAVFGSQFDYSGYSISVVGLSPGTYDLAIYPHSTVSGNYNGQAVRVTVN